jgi:hypothetical protein
MLPISFQNLIWKNKKQKFKKIYIMSKFEPKLKVV